MALPEFVDAPKTGVSGCRWQAKNALTFPNPLAMLVLEISQEILKTNPVIADGLG